MRVGEGDLSDWKASPRGRGSKAARSFFFHGGGVEVAGDGDDHVVGDDGASVPGLEVVEGDGVDGGVLGLAGVGAVGAVDQLDGFADGDAAGVVVAAGDAGVHLALGERELVGLEGGVEEKIHGFGEDGVEVALEAGPAEEVVATPPEVSMLAALASSLSSSLSPSMVAVPLVRQVSP